MERVRVCPQAARLSGEGCVPKWILWGHTLRDSKHNDTAEAERLREELRRLTERI